MLRKRNNIFLKNNAIHVYPNLEAKRRRLLRKIDEEFSVLNSYLWIHGIGFTRKCSAGFEGKIMQFISVILAVIFDANSIIWALETITRPGRSTNKSAIAFVLISILNVVLRFMLYKRRKTIISNFQKLAALYSSIVNCNTLNFKRKLAVLLILNDVASVYFSLYTYFYVLIPSYIKKPGKSIIAVPHYDEYSPHLRGVSFFLSQWSIFCPATAFIFASICYLLKYTIFELNNLVLASKIIKSKTVRKTYIKIVQMKRLINKEFQLVILVDTVIVLSIAFREMFETLFDFHDNLDFMMSRLVYMVFTFCRFGIMCYFANTVTDAVSSLKLTILQTPLNKLGSANFQFFFYLEKAFGHFKIMSSISMTNNLILAAIGSLLSYGIIIATFDLTSSEEEDEDH